MIEGRQYAVRQSQGARDYQEDLAEFSPIKHEDGDGLLMVLADGMGGHRGGAHASRVAVETFIETFSREEGKVPSRLDRALHEANDQVGKDSRTNPELEGMGCTLVGVVATNAGLEWVSVGDSPMWLVRDGHLQRLNEDHSMAPILSKQVELGEMTAEEAARHPQRNALRSAVIGEKMQHIDHSKQPIRFRKGDRLLIASDGVETLSEDVIGALFNESIDADAQTLAEKLVTSVDEVQRKGQDNTTVMVVDLYVEGSAAFGAVDPDAPTEKVTRRTITPIRKHEEPKKSKNMAALLLVLLLLIAGAVAGWVYRAEVKALVGMTEESASGTSGGTGGGTSGTGTSVKEPKTQEKPPGATGSTSGAKKESRPKRKARNRGKTPTAPKSAKKVPGSSSDTPKPGSTRPEDRPLGPSAKEPSGGETAVNPDAKGSTDGDASAKPGITAGN